MKKSGFQSTNPIDSRSRVIIVKPRLKSQNSSQAEESLDELASLASTAGAEVVERVIYTMESITPYLYISRGKAEGLCEMAFENDAEMVIFDVELSPSQERNLESETGVRVIDRPALILDIFAQRALSSEGKIKVELAQLKRLKTRLTGKGIELSRLGGGIGTRGPGEMKLEVDRRRIDTRISSLSKKLATIKKTRNTQRKRREFSGVPVLSLFGYTNSGKSTLINALTGSDELAEDKLFATLDPAARRFNMPDGRPVVIADTVGFIRDMPHTLWDAFRATFEEVEKSDLILHVIDISDPSYTEKLKAAHEVLKDLNLTQKPMITVYNKIDKLPGNGKDLVNKTNADVVYISAISALGMEGLLKSINNMLRKSEITVKLDIPYDRVSDFLEAIYTEGVVHKREDLAEKVRILASIPKQLFGKLEKAGIKGLPVQHVDEEYYRSNDENA